MPWIDSEIAVEVIRDSLDALGFYAESIHRSEKPMIGGKQPLLLTSASKDELYTLFPNIDEMDEEEQNRYFLETDPTRFYWSDYSDTGIHPDILETKYPNVIKFCFPADQHIEVLDSP